MYTYTTSRRLSGTLEATIPVNKDAGQNTLVSGAISGTSVNLVLTTTNGYTITITSGIVGSFTMNQDAAETATLSLDFKSNGVFSVQ